MSAKAPFTRLTKTVRNLNLFQSFAGKNSTQAGEIFLFLFKVQPLYFLLHLFPVLPSFKAIYCFVIKSRVISRGNFDSKLSPTSKINYFRQKCERSLD
jgi:hypothetical protein